MTWQGHFLPWPRHQTTCHFQQAQESFHKDWWQPSSFMTTTQTEVWASALTRHLPQRQTPALSVADKPRRKTFGAKHWLGLNAKCRGTSVRANPWCARARPQPRKPAGATLQAPHTPVALSLTGSTHRPHCTGRTRAAVLDCSLHPEVLAAGQEGPGHGGLTGGAYPEDFGE